MSKTPVLYKRMLPGKAKRGFGLTHPMAQRLWLGPDHLLVVNMLYFRERYKRFYFADIQALTITRTTAGMILNVVFGILAALFALWGAAAYFTFAWDPVAVVFLGGIAAVFILSMAVNALFGPTCRCFLYTPVHCEELYCLGRLWTARRVKKELCAIAEAAQGGAANSTDLDSLAERQSALQNRAAAASPLPLADRAGRALRPDDGKVHASLFFLLLLNAIMCVSLLIWPGLLPVPVSMAFVALLIVVTVAAVIRQRNSNLPRNLRNVTWTTFGYLCLLVVFMYVFVMINEFQRTMGEEQPESLEGIQGTLVQIMNSISLVFDILLSLIGFRYLSDFRRRSTIHEEPAAAPQEE